MTTIYEPVATTDLARILQGMAGPAAVTPEPTDVFPRGKRPDLLITAPGRSPVVIEARRIPAPDLEQDAIDRFGLDAVIHGRELETVIALRYPAALTALNAHTPLEYAAFTRNPGGGVTRFPESGWLTGQAADLADLIRLVSVPQNAVDLAANALQDGINVAAEILDELDTLRPGVPRQIAELLGMDNVPQTRRMACAIIANALVFHERIAGMHPGISNLRAVCGPDVPDPQDQTLTAWAAILAINYWPIFAIGKDILEQLPADTALRLLRRLRETAGQVNGAGVSNAHDLTGRVFQRLISDRKYLATFYTLPPSAALLARLAVAKMDGINWSDAHAIAKLRVADFACGTGALLSAVYEQIAARHEQAGGDAATIHPAMMEEVLYGCDVMPSAIHITGSTLSGIQPEAGFNQSRLYTMPYGRQDDGSVKIGSLELLQSSSVMTLFNTSDPALRTGSIGEETAAQVNVDVQDLSFDLVIMNPPFTSNTKHYDSDDGVVNAAFAAFDSTESDQDDMAARMKLMTAKTCYHGHAGQASAFTALADRKVRGGGVVAFVLPFTAINGPSWAKFRKLIAAQYTDISIISISANGKDMSFSSDTGMAECLVIARRISTGEKPDSRANFVSLVERPAGFAAASEIAKAILNITEIRRLEDGPYGGSAIRIGESDIGEVLSAPLDDYKSGWGAGRISDVALAQTAYSLSAGKLWLPTQAQAVEIPIAHLNQVGKRGLDSQLFISAAHKGPFTKAAPSPVATYPTLWNHNAKKETRMICEPDFQLRVNIGMESKAAELWETASRVHYSRGFRFTSQPIAVAFTEKESIGGEAWPNVNFSDKRFDYAMLIWGNSTLGLLSYWWHSSRQQAGRGRTTFKALGSLPILDFRALSDAQLTTAEAIFNEFRDLELQPAYLADADPNRALLDQRVIRQLLNLPQPTYQATRRLAAKWCAEPSVHGNKRRPPTARYAE